MDIRRFEKRGWIAQGTAALLSVLLLGAGNLALAAQEAAAPEAAPKLSNDQLDSLVAPIALYPDPLLSQTLVASTYPLEIVQAQQWMAKNASLKGDALAEAAQKQDWDPSIQAMAAFPDLVKRMTEDITWTTNLGNAFLAQQEDVMASVQRLRLKAKEAGKLQSTEQQKVETKVVETKTVVVIEPASTQVVYVPTYSPTVIWGPPVYPYPPIYYPPPGYYAGAALVTFGVGMAVGAAISNGGWGWGCGWGGHNTVVINNNNTFVRNNNIKTNNVNVNNRSNTNWNHNASHRGGAPYADRSTASKYGGSARGDSVSTRQAQARSGSASASRQTQSRPSSMQTQSRPGGASGGGGGDHVGNRSIPKSSSSGGGGAFGGASGGAASANRAHASSSRGASSMGSRGGGGRRH